MGRMFRRHPLVGLLTVAYLGLVGWLTLTPRGMDGRDSVIVDLVMLLRRLPGIPDASYSHVEFLANIAMFAPVGMFFVLLLGRRRWWVAVLVGAAITCGIEFTQRFVPGRVPDWRDLVANSTGALLGALLVLVLTRAPRPRSARDTAPGSARDARPRVDAAVQR